jgi:hypothetical protein
MLLALNAFHLIEAVEKSTDYYLESYSPNHHKQKEDIMETNNSDNQANANNLLTTNQNGHHL